tara:strand:+ start:3016 stop:3711 length:696 start_codon:yes stop_codon:yes gene_type:complete
MNREPEPELMNKEDQVIAYAKADFSLGETKLIKFISNYLETNDIKLSSNDLIVDIGCGPGNISEKLSANWPNVNVLGIDGSYEMIKKAESRKSKYKNYERYRNLSYICADIRNINLDQDLFDKTITLLVSNSFIHHISDIDQFFKFLINLSCKDTINFHKDLIRPKDEKTALKLKADCAKKHSSILTNDYYASLKASYRKAELEKKLIEFDLNSMEVIEDNNEYLIVYGKV